MGAGAISDGRLRQFHDTLDLPRYPRGRRGAGVLGRRAFGLQVVPGREADVAHRDFVAGLCLRRDPRRAGAELADRQPFLALRLWRARRRRIDVGGGMAGVGKGRPAGSNRCDGDRRSSRPLFATSDIAHLHRLLRRNVRRLLGAVARPDMVHAFYREGSWISPKRRGLDFDPAVGVRCDHRNAYRLDLSGDDGPWCFDSRRAGHPRLGAVGPGRVDPGHSALCRGRRIANRAACGRLGALWIDLCGLSADAG